MSIEFVNELHKKLGPPGMINLYNTIKDRFGIKEIRKVVKNIIVAATAVAGAKNKINMANALEDSLVNHQATLFHNILGQFETQLFKTKNKLWAFYILKITDITTRYTIPIIIYDITTETVTKMIEKYWLKPNKYQKNNY